MLYSMTGYGKSSIKLGDKSYIIEIKALNSKSLDLNFKAVAELRGKEIDIRKQIAEQLIRGKVDVFFQEEKNNGNGAGLNFNLIENYYHQLQKFSADKNIPIGDVIPAILRFQDISKAELADINDDALSVLVAGIAEAIKNLIQFRKIEGEQLKNDLIERIKCIQELKSSLLPFEDKRMEKLREKLQHDLHTLIHSAQIDENRFEEELIYYLEKMDINEEKVRLDAHCIYFNNVMQEEVMEKGKKLGFIAQEIGREINTIGSKANDAAMQRIVVQMKDELEKIKEQVLNIL